MKQRAGGHIQSATDIQEAEQAGAKAVELAVAGISRQMVAYRRISSSPYLIRLEAAPLKDVANVENKIPREWINQAGNGVLPPLVEYLLPLIQGELPPVTQNGLPRHLVLDKTPVQF